MSAVVVDTSAAVATLLREPGWEELLDALDGADERVMAAPTLVELGIVMEARKGPTAVSVVDRLLRDAEIEVVPFDHDLSARALEGWRRFGKGRHRAALNLGDCFSYALAVALGAPVLCVGDDFAATDVDVIRPGS
jgi:ribonuclease VapC